MLQVSNASTLVIGRRAAAELTRAHEELPLHHALCRAVGQIALGLLADGGDAAGPRNQRDGMWVEWTGLIISLVR